MAKKRRKPVVDKKTLRLLDANLNRAREGLRVVEDTARFLWNSKRMYGVFRDIRHQLQSITQDRYKDLIKSRHSRSDVGRKIPEKGRTSVASVVAANIRRAQEATRVLEEYSKVFSPLASADFKVIRYKLYDAEKEILKKV